jgi:hypothetical protein
MRSTGLRVGLVVLIGMALRVYGISAIDLWGDEAFSWMEANSSFTNLLAATTQDNYPPLHNIILYFTMALFGDSEIALRAPSALMGTLTIWVVYLAGKAGGIGAPASSPRLCWHFLPYIFGIARTTRGRHLKPTNGGACPQLAPAIRGKRDRPARRSAAPARALPQTRRAGGRAAAVGRRT